MHQHTGECLIACDVECTASVLLELQADLADVRAGGAHAPWITRAEAIRQLEEEIAKLRG